MGDLGPVLSPHVTAADEWDTVEMTARDFAALDEVQRRKYRLFRCPGFEYPEQHVPVNPYFIGLWLGDRTRRSTAIASNHEGEIRDFLVSYAAELDLHLVWHGGINYTIAGRTSLADRPLPGAPETLPTLAKQAERSVRSTIISRRIASGWKIVSPEVPGEAHTWQAPENEEKIPSSEVQWIETRTLPARPAKSSATKPPPRRQPDCASPELVFRSSPTLPQYDIPDDPLSDLRDDPEFMHVVGTPEVREQSVEESQQDLLMNMIGLDSDDEDMDDDKEPTIDDQFDSSDDDDNSDVLSTDARPSSSHPNGRRQFRLHAGRRAYGDLQDDEQNELLDQLVTQPTHGKKKINKVSTLLRALDELRVLTTGPGAGPAIDKKHIPEIYMKNTRAVRLAILAGLIDSEGTYLMTESGSGSLRFSQIERWHKTLYWDVVKLAQSLGFTVGTSRRLKEITSLGTVVYELTAIISGNVHEVPCLLARKKALDRVRAQTFNHAIRSISLEAEPTEWSGFRVDKDQLYLRHDHVVLHNSGFEER